MKEQFPSIIHNIYIYRLTIILSCDLLIHEIAFSASEAM